MITIHQKTKTCKECHETFLCSIDFEVHMIKFHKEEENYKCDQCGKPFFVKWRLIKHQEIHSDKVLKKCHFFNNNKYCPFEEIGCKYQHQESPQCLFKDNCRNKLCQFRHQSKFQCSKCDNFSSTKTDLEYHINRTHAKTDNINKLGVYDKETDDPELTCKYCSESFDDINELIDHFTKTAHNLDEVERRELFGNE